MSKPFARVCLWGGCTLAFAALSGVVLQWGLSYLTLKNADASGKLIDVGGHRLHLLCEGQGEPTVVLEAGLPGSSLAWKSVTADIALFTTVCTYDRAGYAWSDASPFPRSTGNIVRELRTLLQNAGIGPPYVLVGHSFGGLIVQLFAGRFPREVAGMVLVDSSHPDQVHRTIEVDSMNTLGQGLRVLSVLGIPRLIFPVPAGNPASRDNSVRTMEEKLQYTTRSIRAAASELLQMRESLREVGAHRPQLGAKPLVVLTEGRRRKDFWYELQENLAMLSTAGEWQIAEQSGHFIHHDQPEIVVDAIRRTVESVRTGNASNSSATH